MRANRLGGAAALALLAFASARALAGPTDPPRPSPRLERFESEAALRRYIADVAGAQRARERWSARATGLRFAQAQPATGTQSDAPPPDPCPPERPDCRPAAESIIVTGSRVPPHNSSITNNQTIGVDEGDIVKQVGQFLLILQDGRIFSVDTRPGGAPGLAVADRVNVYRDAAEDMWYDEMLVAGDRVLVTGYSYEHRATEFSVFRVDPKGRLTSLGTFYRRSYDYYSSDNYATRIVGDRLVVYTPVDIGDVDAKHPLQWPIVWRWTPRTRGEPEKSAHKLLFSVRDVYRPVLPTLYPVIHAISVCPLSEVASERELSCRTTGFVGPTARELYVSPTDAYLWTSMGDGDAEDFARAPGCSPKPWADGIPAAVYRLPLAGGDPGVLGARGEPVDHFAIEAHGKTLHALLFKPPGACGDEADARRRRWWSEETPPDPHLSFFAAGLDSFGPLVEEAPVGAYTALPDPGSALVADRFTDRYLVYGGMGRWGSWPPDAEERERRPDGKVFAVPLRRPAATSALTIPHTINRVERVGDDVVMSGYRDASGLQLSYLGLKAAPHVASTVKLEGRFESEGRSHAFNSLVEPGGAGIMGIPTVRQEADSGRWWFRSGASDVSFLAVDPAGALRSLGPLATSVKPMRGRYGIADQAIPGYACEVSCIDWYGNTRPIFTDGRVFALTGAEIVEGRVEAGAIREVRRLQVAGPTRPRAP
ncbi:MAG: beta-propeller domain-containing protein [Alphaproteobacteria bacterium]|nr:beta-propeller domain-containing protein [Alphaproteobacteria bacterium]